MTKLPAAAVAGLTMIVLAGCGQLSITSRIAAPTPDVTISYRAIGTGPLVVLLPSAFRDAEDLEPLAHLVARSGFRVLLPQPRGIPPSTGPLTGLTLHHLAADVAGVIRQEGGGPAVIAGHAYGNWVARMVATDHPQRVLGVAVLAASASGPTPPDLVQAIATAADVSQPEATRIAALRLAFFAPGNDPRRYLTGWHLPIRDAQRRAAAAVPQSIYWQAGGKPVLEVQAADDPFLPAARRGDLRAALGDRVTTVLVEGASHALIPERPCLVASALVRFSARLNRLTERPVRCP